ncbi:MAG: preprotein translocase subunit YajC [Clostridia bacterium]|nr:preprotein translocase subunit YajC [Clostridia bacterium]
MNVTQIILIVFIVLLIVMYPILIFARNKKENTRMQEQTNSLKRGDKVLLTCGVYGEIVDMHEENGKTIITIETGKGNHKGYLAVDAYAVYTVIKDEPVQEEKVETVKEADTTKPSQEDEKANKEKKGE